MGAGMSASRRLRLSRRSKCAVGVHWDKHTIRFWAPKAPARAAGDLSGGCDRESRQADFSHGLQELRTRNFGLKIRSS